MNYSIRHDAFYDAMIRELLQYAGFNPDVMARLRWMRGMPSASEAEWVDELYQIYSEMDLIDPATQW